MTQVGGRLTTDVLNPTILVNMTFSLKVSLFFFTTALSFNHGSRLKFNFNP